MSRNRFRTGHVYPVLLLFERNFLSLLTCYCQVDGLRKISGEKDDRYIKDAYYVC